MNDKEIANQKDIEYYASSVDALFNTSLEHDKSILSLSAAGIGLLTTLLTTIGSSSIYSIFLYAIAILCFLFSIASTLWIFKENKNYIIESTENPEYHDSKKLSALDTISSVSFLLGAFFTALIGITTAINSYQSKEESMKQEAKQENIQRLTETIRIEQNCNIASESFNNASRLRPKPNQVTQTSNVSTTSQPVKNTPTNQNNSSK